MRKLAITGTVLGALVALSAIGSTMATAALPEFLPKGVKFTSASGAGTLAFKGGNAITCSSDKNTGEITGTKTVTVDITFEKCSFFGILGLHSLGDAENIVLIPATGEICYINKTAKTVGLVLTPTSATHIETGGQLALVTGSLIGELKPVNTKSLSGELVLTEKSGEQTQLKCLGGAETHLSGSENEGTTKDASEATTDKIGYLTKEVEVMA
jgi:hypothetical protein